MSTGTSNPRVRRSGGRAQAHKSLPPLVLAPPHDELANWLTHLLGLVLAILGAAALCWQVRGQSDSWRVLGCDVYAATLVALYAASTLSHSFRRPALRGLFRMLDQSAIFLLIVGTQTPFALAYLRQGRGWFVLLACWTLAAVGIAFKLGVRRLHNVSTPVYLAIGWLPVVNLDEIVARVPAGALWWVLAGGALYTLGTYFLARDDRLRYGHAIWHLSVVAASVCHYLAVWQYVATG